MRPSIRHLIPILALAPLAFASEPSLSASESTPTLSTPVDLADRLLAETSTAADAARGWLRENLSNEAIGEMASGAETAVIERFNRALDQARLEHERSLGLFAYDPASVDQSDPWTPIARDATLPSRIVLLVHGLDEGGTIWDNAAPALAHASHTVVRFNYPNDQPIRASADRLVESLRELNERGVSSVDIVGHSMGGLVARDALTRPEHYHSDARARDGLPAVPRFIMLATPNHGSPLACLRGVMEVRDQFVRWTRSDDKLSSGLLGSMVDGRGEAGDDLRPGSAFLADLNSRPLPRNVQITIVTGGFIAASREKVERALDNVYVRRVLGTERCDRWKCGADGVCDEVGDGVVPGASALLEGVNDVVNVRTDHRSMIRVLEPIEATRSALGMENPTPEAIPIILDRLSRSAPE